MSDDSMYTEIFDDDGNLRPVLRSPYISGDGWEFWDYSAHTYGSIDNFFDALAEIREIEHGERHVTRCAWTLSHPDAQEYDYNQLEATPQARRALYRVVRKVEKEEERKKREEMRSLSPRSHKKHSPHKPKQFPSLAIQRERELILKNAVEYQDQQELDRVRKIVELMCMAQGCLQMGSARFGLLRWTNPEGHWGKKHPVLLQYQNKWFCEKHVQEITVGLERSGLPSYTRLFLVSRSFPVRRKELATL